MRHKQVNKFNQQFPWFFVFKAVKGFTFMAIVLLVIFGYMKIER